MKTVVVSAVNVRKGGTLTILRDCLACLSTLPTGEYHVVALVHSVRLLDFPNIKYVEVPWSVKSWLHRLWCEYVTMNQISHRLGDIDLWLSLHDTTPRVHARRQAVYCQTSFPFLKWRWADLKYDYKIVLFSLLTRFAYRVNVRKNQYLVVQAEWLRHGLSRMLNVPQEKFVVFPPLHDGRDIKEKTQGGGELPGTYRFIYAATPDCHKNFEIVCKSADYLETKLGQGKFCVLLTISGTENKYARNLWQRYRHVQSIRWCGFLPYDRLFELYGQTDCLVFPSRIETWGLPISEYASWGHVMLLADLPYAYETAAGCTHVAFFDVDDAYGLAAKMECLISGDTSILGTVPSRVLQRPFVQDWKALLDLLLS